MRRRRFVLLTPHSKSVHVAGGALRARQRADDPKIRDQIYFPFLQVPDKFTSEAVAGLMLVLRTGPELLSLVSAVRAHVAGPTQDQPIYAVRTMEQIISGSLAERRFTMLVVIIFAASALLLAAVGIYAVMSYAVTRRGTTAGGCETPFHPSGASGD